MPSDSPAISVVVPVYNTERYLNECLDSLANQTLSDLEVICVDDGSSDGCPALLDARAEADPRFRVIHQPNGGVSAARNAGLEAARGEFVVFWDSDDYVELVACEKLVNLARRDNADIVVFGGVTFPTVKWIDLGMDTRDHTVIGEPHSALFNEVGSYPLMCNKMYRRSMLMNHDVRFNTALKLGEDHAFQFMAFPLAGNIVLCRDAFYHYRCEREGSAIKVLYADVQRKVELHFEVVEYVLAEWAERGWIDGHAEDLCKWASEFLADGVRQLPLANRRELVPRFRHIVDTYGLVPNNTYKDDHARRSTRFIGGADLDTPRPLVTVVATSCPDVYTMRYNFISLANQSMQSIEILCVDAHPGTESSKALAEEIAADSRSRLVSSAEQALAEAKGSYILFARLSDHYLWDTVFLLLGIIGQARMDGVEPQFAYCRDYRDILRTKNLARIMHMHSSDGTGPLPEKDRTWLRASDVPNEILSVASLSSANKLWRTSFAREQDLHPYDPASVGRALMAADVFCSTAGNLLTLGTSDELNEAGAIKMADDYNRSMAELRAWLDERDLFASREQDWANAYLSGCLTRANLIRSSEALTAYLARLEKNLRGTKMFELHDHRFFENTRDYDEAMALLEEGAETYSETAVFSRVDNLLERIDDLEDLAGSLFSSIAYQTGRLDALCNSLSYRLGRAITAMPRTGRDMVKKVLHR